MMKLEIELVPQTSFFNNVRAIVSKEEWDVIRKECYKSAGYKCQICGGVGEKWPVECHEIWQYNDTTHTQTLTGMIALCPACHEVKHFGYANVTGNTNRALSHFMKINELDKFEATRLIDKSFRLWKSRSQYQWTVDMTYLVNRVSNIQ